MPIAAITPAVATLITGAGATAAGIYSAKRSADTNRDSLRASERSDERALAYEREQAAQRERLYNQEAQFRASAYRDALEADQRRWQDYTRLMAPHWSVGAGALQSLTGLAGLPDIQMSDAGGGQFQPSPGSGGTPPVPGAMTLAGLGGVQAAPGAVGRTSARSRLRRPMPATAAGGADPFQTVMSMAQLAGVADPSALGPMATPRPMNLTQLGGF